MEITPYLLKILKNHENEINMEWTFSNSIFKICLSMSNDCTIQLLLSTELIGSVLMILKKKFVFNLTEYSSVSK